MSSVPPASRPSRSAPPRGGRNRRRPLIPEQYLRLPGKATWDDYVKLDSAHCSYDLRLAFADESLEFMSISEDHERIKRMISSLIEAWCLDHDIPFDATGSTTLRLDRRQAGEPDDSFCFPRRHGVPDLVVEVQIARPGLNKLGFYAALGIPEVWIWHDHKIQVWRLVDSVYQQQRESQVLTGFDLDFAAEAATTLSIYDAVKSQRRRRS